MAHSSSQPQAQPQPQPVRHVSAEFGRVAAGGPIAELHQTIQERLMTTDWNAQADADVVPVEARAIEVASRLAGPLLLVMAYASVTAWWF